MKRVSPQKVLSFRNELLEFLATCMNNPFVIFAASFVSELLIAMFTRVRFLPSMNSFMSFQDGRLYEIFVAKFACKRFFSCMDPFMSLQGIFLLEFLATILTD